MNVEKPLTPEQVQKKLKNGRLTVTIAIDLNDLIDNDRESLNELMGDRILEGVLCDVSYLIAGYTYNSDKTDDPGKVILEVSGKPVVA